MLVTNTFLNEEKIGNYGITVGNRIIDIGGACKQRIDKGG